MVAKFHHLVWKYRVLYSILIQFRFNIRFVQIDFPCNWLIRPTRKMRIYFGVFRSVTFQNVYLQDDFIVWNWYSRLCNSSLRVYHTVVFEPLSSLLSLLVDALGLRFIGSYMASSVSSVVLTSLPGCI